VADMNPEQRIYFPSLFHKNTKIKSFSIHKTILLSYYRFFSLPISSRVRRDVAKDQPSMLTMKSMEILFALNLTQGKYYLLGRSAFGMTFSSTSAFGMTFSST
jgi:hypothetical protein